MRGGFALDGVPYMQRFTKKTFSIRNLWLSQWSTTLQSEPPFTPTLFWLLYDTNGLRGTRGGNRMSMALAVATNDTRIGWISIISLILVSYLLFRIRLPENELFRELGNDGQNVCFTCSYGRGIEKEASLTKYKTINKHLLWALEFYLDWIYGEFPYSLESGKRNMKRGIFLTLEVKLNPCRIHNG